MTGRFAVDSSAIVAILAGEPEAEELYELLARSTVAIGWPTVLEVRLWTIRNAPAGMPWLDRFVANSSTQCVAFDRERETIAEQAFRRFGKGRHPAALNFGDCMAYAVARHDGLPLLFKGSDFNQTDVSLHPASVLV